MKLRYKYKVGDLVVYNYEHWLRYYNKVAKIIGIVIDDYHKYYEIEFLDGTDPLPDNMKPNRWSEDCFRKILKCPNYLQQ